MASAKTKRNQWRAFPVLALTLCTVASAYGQSTALDTAVRQHERAVQDATRREARDVDSLSPDTDTGNISQRTKPQAGVCRVIQTIRLEGHPDAMGAQPQEVSELQTLDKLRDEQLAPLIDACEKAGRNNCKGEAIARQFAATNGFGLESMKRESNPGTLGSPFSFNGCPGSDKGGCSYGPLQIAADTGMMNDFMEALRRNPIVEAQDFYGALQAAGGVAASQRKDPTFIQIWMQLTARDPQFVQYQIDALINQNLYPVVQELQKVGVNFNDLSQAQKDAIFSAAVQHGAGVQAKKNWCRQRA